MVEEINYITSVVCMCVCVCDSRDWGYCLDDEPSQHPFNFPVLPPGVMYDIDHQCRLQYGPDAQFCEGIDVSSV